MGAIIQEGSGRICLEEKGVVFGPTKYFSALGGRMLTLEELGYFIFMEEEEEKRRKEEEEQSDEENDS